jgi:hypothetical protein
VSAIRRFAKAIGDRPDDAPTRIYTTIATVTPGGSADGTYAVTVAINADNVPAPYLAAYTAGHTPTVGDRVAVDLTNGSPLILGVVAGLPAI